MEAEIEALAADIHSLKQAATKQASLSLGAEHRTMELIRLMELMGNRVDQMADKLASLEAQQILWGSIGEPSDS